MVVAGECNGYVSMCTILTYIIVFLISISTSNARILSEANASYKSSGADSHMLLSANELSFDHKTGTITARGQVKIEYNGNKIMASHVIYNQKTKRVIANGDVEIVDSKGIKIHAEKIDLTDDLSEGFINSLRVETIDHISFSSESSEFRKGHVAIFNNGIYTTCKSSCNNEMEKDIAWQIKAKKIIWNRPSNTMRFENSHFEILGIPVIWLPFFEIANPDTKRKSGFLMPRLEHQTELGISLTNSYFWNIAPNYDLTFSAIGYSKQGILTQEVWRHHLESGNYDFRFAHIYQSTPNISISESSLLDKQQDRHNRYMAATQGRFTINPYWVYGWDIMAQSDYNFSRIYNLDGYSSDVHRSQIYLSGLAERNYFDVRFYHFTVQENISNDNILEHYSQQPWILPRIDYTFIPNVTVLGGELQFTANLQTVYRKKANSIARKIPFETSCFIDSTGTSSRFTVDLEWKRSFISHYGPVLSPIFSLRGDAIDINHATYKQANLQSNVIRSMATAGLEVRYPILVSSDNASNIIEPTIQILVRNDERYAERLMNEDAQSFVFDATTLFLRDKFSGYDRIEGGSRINLGVRYSGDIHNSWSIYSLIGQSYHLGGRNSFSSDKITNIGADSGLETTRSDYVAMLGVDDSGLLSFAARGRFDEKNMSTRRGEIEFQKQWKPFALDIQYAYIKRQPSYGYAQNRQEISAQSIYELDDKWKMNVAATYDTISETLVRTNSGLSYQDECFGLMFNYMKIRNPGDQAVSQKWNFLLSFRTIGDLGSRTSSWW